MDIQIAQKKITDEIKSKYVGWDLVVKNNNSDNVRINIEDQYTTSAGKSVIVYLTDYEEAIVNKKTRKLNWNFTLNPEEKKELGFKYNIKYSKFSSFEVR